MNLEQFDIKYANFKGADKITIECDYPEHRGDRKREIGKTAARRNIQKRNSKDFMCRDCCMEFDNSTFKKGQGRQNNEVINVICPTCSIRREMKKSCYYGSMKQPYKQVCNSCAQLGKKISEEQKEKTSNKLKGVKKSDEFKQKLSDYMTNNLEGIERGRKNLIPGSGGGWNKGLETPEEVKIKMAEAHLGAEFTEEHCQHISEGRKKMLDEQGGLLPETREKLSKKAIEQYKKGFRPHLHHMNGWYYSTKLQKKIFYRSSYEKKAYMMLDEDKDVLSYEVEPLSIEFYNPEKNIMGNYLVDLKVNYVDGKSEYIEIKPESRLKEKVVQAKIAAAKKKLGTSFRIWNEVHLFGAIDTKRKIENFRKDV
jgi:hypothetical protein